MLVAQIWPTVRNLDRKRREDGVQSTKWKWHLDEAFVKVNKEKHCLWCAADHEAKCQKATAPEREIRKRR